MAARTLIISNRLPVAVHFGPARELTLQDTAGGLATGLRAYHQHTLAKWIGWVGDLANVSPGEQRRLDDELLARRFVSVPLSSEHIERYYHGFANRVLWPLFHYQIDRVPVDSKGWDAFRAVNEAFADVIVREYQADDLIWIHDFHLFLLPALLRRRLPAARIGFFLHIPFPSSEVFRALPWRSEILAGLLGADLIGFHTFAYLRHFLGSLLHVLGLESDIDCVPVGNRRVQLGVFPMGVDAARLTALAQSPGVTTTAAAIRAQAGGRKIVLGIDRLDYTKGIPRRLEAIERLFERQPRLRDRVRYIQVAVPSRAAVDSYQRFKRQVEESVGRINGLCGTLSSTPVHYIHRSLSETELVALYSAADVMLVTPLRDGMNLVAKEFVAVRSDLSGALVLSEFAGAATELDGALLVNPYDIDGVVATLHRALLMAPTEQARRMQRLRRRVTAHDVHRWAASFLERLDATEPVPAGGKKAPATAADVLSRIPVAARLMILLDYDGTLTPIVRDPALAAPDQQTLALLRALSAAPNVRVAIVSGRPRDTLEQWFGDLPIALWAEHGFWSRTPEGKWLPAAAVPPNWSAKIEPILRDFAARTPGAEVELKSASVTWHYRSANRAFGSHQAHELRMLLGDALSNQPFEVLEGKKVIEVRFRGISKALVVQRFESQNGGDRFFVAIGDDRTDEDLFRALPPSNLTIAVGRRPADAAIRLSDYRAVHELLRLLTARQQGLDRLPVSIDSCPAAG